MPSAPARFRSFSLILLLLLTACSPKPPAKPPMAPATPAQAAAPVQPLSLTCKLPQGLMQGADARVSILAGFDQAMVPLQALPGDAGGGPMFINPGLAGKYRWLGTRVLAFVPEKPLPMGTHYHVRVPKGTRALNGALLPQDETWDFTTARPHWMESYPRANATFVPWKQPIFLEFDQPMDPARAEQRFLFILKARSIELWAQDRRGGPSRPVGFNLRRYAESDRRIMGTSQDPSQVLVMEPTENYPLDSVITVRVKPGLLGAQGTLGLETEQTFSFTSTNRFKLNHGRIESNYNELALRLNFTNRVPEKELSKVQFIPAAAFRDAYPQEMDDRHVTHWLYADLKPETAYTVTVPAGLKDASGQTLGQAVTLKLTSPSLPAYLSAPTHLGVVENDGPARVPVVVTNAFEVHRNLALMSRDEAVRLLQRDEVFYESWEEPFSVRFDRQELWQPTLKRNQYSHVPLELKPFLAGRASGFLFADLWLDPKVHYRSFLQVTGLGVSGKFSAENNLIWVTDLKHGLPAAGAEVELRDDANQVLFRGTTDALGVCETPGWERLGLKHRQLSEWYGTEPRVWAFVSRGEDQALLVSNWEMGIEPYEFGLNYNYHDRPEHVVGYFFSERGLYRANETVFLKGIVRAKARGQWSLPEGRTVDVSVNDARGQELVQRRLTTSAYGSVELSLKLAPTAPSGWYNLKATTPEGELVGNAGFRVEAYQPAQFEVKVTSERSQYIAGDNFSGFLEGRYLYGAPMARESADWLIMLEPYHFTPKGWNDWTFGADDWWDEGRDDEFELAHAAGALDDQGRLRCSPRLNLGRFRNSAALTLEGTVTPASHQTASGFGQAIVHRGEYYIGLKLDRSLVTVGQPLSLKTAAVRIDGQVMPQRLTWTVVRREWTSVLKAGVNGRYEWVTDRQDRKLKTQEVQTAVQPLDLSFVPDRPGFYFLSLSGRDNRGNRVLTTSSFYAIGAGEVDWERRNDDRIDLVADQAGYRPGETAHILIKSPYREAKALITVEREHILRRFVVSLKGNAETFDLPILATDLPNIYVSAMLVKGRLEKALYDETGEDLAKPSFKMGYLQLPIETGSQRLAVTVKSNQAEYRPRDPVEVDLKVLDAKGRGTRAEVTLAVVDKGVLNLIDFKTPDAFPSFFGPRPLGVRSAETRAHVIGQRNYGEKGENRGGGGGEEGAYRSDFLTTAFYGPSLHTDGDGRLKVRFKLPDNLTTFKLMATAHTRGSQFGAGENSLVVNKPFLLLEALPRFLRQGDRCSAGVTAHNRTGQAVPVKIIASTRNAKLTGEPQQEIRLLPNQSQAIRFNYEALGDTAAVFRFFAQTPAGNDGLELKLPVNTVRPIESVALYGQTEGQVRESLVIPTGIVPHTGQLEVAAAATGLSGIHPLAQELLGYPYGCLEQRLSALMPLITAEPLVRAFKLQVLEGRPIRPLAQQTLDQVALFQKENGGLGLWRDPEDRSRAFISSYALWVLAQAKTQGYTIDPGMVARVVHYLSELSRDPKTGHWANAPRTILNVLVFRDFALSAWQPVDLASLHESFDQRAQLSLFSQAILLRSLFRAQSDPQMQSELERGLMNQLKRSAGTASFEELPDPEADWTWQSNVRTTAVVLSTLLEVKGEFPEAELLARWLLESRPRERGWSTQENAFVFVALHDFFRRYEGAVPEFKAQVRLGQKAVLAATFSGRELEVRRVTQSLDGFPQGAPLDLVVGKTGVGRLYYSARLAYRPAEPVPVREEGLAVYKRVLAVNSRQEVRECQAGEVYQVEITVASSVERHFVVVDDGLAAGFEPIRTGFATESADLTRRIRRGEEEDAQRRLPSGFQHTEQYDDHVLAFADRLEPGAHTFSYYVRAVTRGDYALPRAQCQEMYHPEVFGWSSEGRMQIK